LGTRIYGQILLDKAEQTPEICLEAVCYDGMVLERVKIQTPDICLAAVKQSPAALQFVREQTPDICLAAVIKNGVTLQFVREQTPDICMAAVIQNGLALQFVREQTPDICMAAVTQTEHALKFVKEQTHELCLRAVQKDVLCVNYVRADLLTKAIYEPLFQAWIKRAKWLDWCCLSQIDVAGRTRDICEYAMNVWFSTEGRGYKSPFSSIPVKFQTPEMCLATIRRSPQEIKYVRADIATAELWRVAIQNDVTVLKHLREQTVELCQYAIDTHGWDALQYIREPTPEWCKNAVIAYGRNIRYISQQTPELCRLAVEQTPYAIENILNQTPELCRIAIHTCPEVIKFVREPTSEQCIYALTEDITTLEYVPEHHQTFEVCELVATYGSERIREFLKRTFSVRDGFVFERGVCLGKVETETESEED